MPRTHRSAILDEATERGLIPGYRLLTYSRRSGFRAYQVLGGEIRLKFPGACGEMACPSGTGAIRLLIDYRRTAAAKAESIRRIAHAQMPYAKIIFGPPYYP